MHIQPLFNLSIDVNSISLLLFLAMFIDFQFFTNMSMIFWSKITKVDRDDQSIFWIYSGDGFLWCIWLRGRLNFLLVFPSFSFRSSACSVKIISADPKYIEPTSNIHKELLDRWMWPVNIIQGFIAKNRERMSIDITSQEISLTFIEWFKCRPLCYRLFNQKDIKIIDHLKHMLV